MVTVYKLHQNFPNPFNPTTTVKYQIPELSFVTINIYDVLGNEVASMINEEKPAGNFEVEFSAKGGSAFGGDGLTLPSGIYFYTIQAGKFTDSKKMILLNFYMALKKIIIFKYKRVQMIQLMYK